MITRCPDCRTDLAIDRIGPASNPRRVLLCRRCWTFWPVEARRHPEPLPERKDIGG